MKFLFSIFILVHALIHLMGFVKAFNLAVVSQLHQNVSRPIGLLWLSAAILFILVAIFFYVKKDWCWMITIPAICLSQYLIITSWQDAKFGTIANIIILAATIVGFGVWYFNSHQTHSQKADISYWQATFNNVNRLLTS